MTDQQQDPFKTVEEVRDWVQRMQQTGACKEFEGWPISLFRGDYYEIIEFLADRFRKTDNPMEFYFCIPYLITDLTEDELLKTFTEARHTNIPPKEEEPKLNGKVAKLNGKVAEPATRLGTPRRL